MFGGAFGVYLFILVLGGRYGCQNFCALCGMILCVLLRHAMLLEKEEMGEASNGDCSMHMKVIV